MEGKTHLLLRAGGAAQKQARGAGRGLVALGYAAVLATAACDGLQPKKSDTTGMYVTTSYGSLKVDQLVLSGTHGDGTTVFDRIARPTNPTLLSAPWASILIVLDEAKAGTPFVVRVDGLRQGDLVGTGTEEVLLVRRAIVPVDVVLGSPVSCEASDCVQLSADAVDPGDGAEPASDGVCGADENASTAPQDCPAVNGDGFCTHSESCETAPSDCGECPAFCGDESCTGSEDAGTCPTDCPAVGGDGLCTHSETCASMPNDCGECPIRVVELRDISDTWVSDCSASASHARSGTLQIDEYPCDKTAYLQLVGLPDVDAGQLIEAKLFAYVLDTGDDPEVRRVKESWNPGDVTYSKRPDVEKKDDELECKKDKWSSVDVTETFSLWLSGEEDNYGVALYESGADGCDICSSECDEEDWRPYFEVTYRGP